jgi:hypothetical protein
LLETALDDEGRDTMDDREEAFPRQTRGYARHRLLTNAQVEDPFRMGGEGLSKCIDTYVT